jgi:hypothetical protein
MVVVYERVFKRWYCFVDNVCFDVGVGDRVHFWQDRWCGGQLLKERYPALYSLEWNVLIWYLVPGVKSIDRLMIVNYSLLLPCLVYCILICQSVRVMIG